MAVNYFSSRHGLAHTQNFYPVHQQFRPRPSRIGDWSVRRERPLIGPILRLQYVRASSSPSAFPGS
jgi:hypothetical protein